MDIIRSIARWLCAIGLGLAIGAWIFAATTSTTALNRDTTKQWLDKSGIYSTNLGALMQVQTAGGGAAMVTHSALDKALSATFTPDYVQQGAETALDGLYDWLDGKTQTVAFSIPVQQKADEFKQNLTTALSAELQNLPACTTRLGSMSGQPTCIPAGMTPQSMAEQIASRGQNAFLTAPITPESLQGASAAPTGTNYLPQSVQFIRLMVLVLPMIALALAGSYILLSPDKLRGMVLVGRQMVFSSVFLLIAGLVMQFVGSAAEITVDSQSSRDAITALLNPVIKTIVPGIGGTISLFSGIVTAVGIALWVAGRFMINKRPKAGYMQPQAQYQHPAGSVTATNAAQQSPAQMHIPQQPVQTQPITQQPQQMPAAQQPAATRPNPTNRPKPPIIQ